MNTEYTDNNSHFNNSDYKTFPKNEKFSMRQDTQDNPFVYSNGSPAPEQNSTAWSAAIPPKPPESTTNNTHDNTDLNNNFNEEGSAPNDENNNNTPNEEKLGKKNERFIMAALLSAVIIVAVIIGLGWAVFYPKNNITTAIDEAVIEAQTAQQAQDSTNLEQNADNDVVIFYGGEKDVKKDVSDTSDVSISDTDDTSQTDKKPLITKPQTETSPATLQAKQTNTATTPVHKPLVAKKTASKKIIKKQTIVQKEPSLIPKKTTQGIIAVPNTKQHIYWVQVFSTSNKNKANTLKNDLEKNGVMSTIITKNINQKIYYRLRIGPYYNKAEGTKFLQWIKQSDKFKDAYVTQTYI